MDPDVTSGMWLQKRRKSLDLTREELARCAGCSESALRKIETNERRPSKQLAQLLANCLEIPPSEQSKFIHYIRNELLHDPFDINLRPQLRLQLRPNSYPSPFEHPDLISSSSLPVFPAPLIGRESELSALGQLLCDPNCRLLTLTGLGGIGKTRLAVEAAAAVRQNFRDGVHFVSLASLNSAEFILTTIASVLGFSFYGPAETKSQLISYLSHKSLLLVLDNFESFVESAGLLTGILQQSPGVKMLVTSRERLNLTCEWLFELHGLPVPPTEPAWAVEDYDSAALFIQVARRVRTDFVLSTGDKPAVARICRLLEGMPLGIQLAASWIHMLSCQEIAQEIEHSLDFLATTLRDMPERHRSLRAVFDHSWDLLSEEERKVLCGLTVFPGGFYRQAAEHICQASLPLLSALVAKSLVMKLGGSRYGLHELVRQYASSYLRANPEKEAYLHDRHCRFYLAWIKEHEAALTSGRQKQVLDQLNFEIDNLRQAWEWAAEHRLADLLRDATWPFWYSQELRGLFREGEAVFLQAIERVKVWDDRDQVGSKTRRMTLTTLQIFTACLALRQGRIDEAAQSLRQCLDPLKSANDRVGLANALLMYGTACMFIGQFQEALDCLKEASMYARDSNRPWEHCLSTVLIGRVENQIGNYPEAQGWIREGLALGQKLGDPNLVSFTISTLIETEQALGRLDRVELLLREGIDLAKENGNRFTHAMLKEQLAQHQYSRGNAAEAHQLCQASAALYRELGDDWSLSRALNILGNFKLVEEDFPPAEQFFIEALKVANQANSYANVLDALTGIASVQANCGSQLLAAELTFFILQSPFSTRQAQNAAGLLFSELKSRLAPEQVEAAQASAQAQSLDEIVKRVAVLPAKDFTKPRCVRSMPKPG